MNRSFLTHFTYALITIGMFVMGSQWARPSKGAVGKSTRAAEYGSGSSEIRGLASLSPEASLKGSSRGAEQAPVFALENGIGYGITGSDPAWARLLDQPTDAPPLTKRQISELVLAAIRSRNSLERRKAFDRILQEMESENFTVGKAIAIRSVMHLSGADGEQWRMFNYAWGANDPAAVLAYIDQFPEQDRPGFTSNMLPGLASADPQAAIDLVASFDGKLRQQLTGRLLEGLVDNSPALATDYVMVLAESGDPNARQYMARLAREVLDTTGLEGGREWAEGLPQGPLLNAALMPVANEFASTDPLGAAEWAEGFLGESEHRASRVFGEVVREWGDWKAASEWVETLPAGQGQRDALSAVYGFKGATQPQVAVQEIINMPESPDKNYAINGFISGLAHRDGESAVIWAAEITEPNMRTEAIIRAGKQFYRQDEQAAVAWFASADLPVGSWARVTGANR